MRRTRSSNSSKRVFLEYARNTLGWNMLGKARSAPPVRVVCVCALLAFRGGRIRAAPSAAEMQDSE